MYDSGELAAAATSITVSGLNGDVDEQYEIIWRLVGGANTAFYLTFNTDTGANYGMQRLRGQNTSVSAARYVDNGIIIGSDTTVGNITFGRTIINVKSGYLRTILHKESDEITGTTVGDINIWGGSWNNTVDNITQMVLTATASDGFGIGSRIIILKKNVAALGSRTGTLDVQGKLKGCFQKVYETTLTGAATTHTITGLDGNTDVLYRLRIRSIGGASSTQITLRPNNDSGSNYGYQELDGNSSSAIASRGTSSSSMLLNLLAYNTNELAYSDTLLFAKSGYIRTAITTDTSKISTTTVTQATIAGTVWNNSADNITSLVILGNQTDGLGIGTEITLERYNTQ